MSNYPLRYKLSWLPRFLAPSAGHAGIAAKAETLLPDARDTVRLVFIGDISAVANQRAPIIDAALQSVLASADLVIGNCESPVVERPRFGGSRFGARHAMTEAFLADVLGAARIDPAKTVLSLANNHIFDQGIEGFDETLAALDRLGIRTIGAVRDGWPAVVNAGSLRVGFAAFTQWRNAPDEMFGGRVITLDDIARAGWDIPDVGADLLCAIPHWDWEFRQEPQLETRALARRLAEHGVGLIAGHHAHIVQPVERLDDAIVAYGLGDFVGTAWPFVRRPLRTGALLVADVSVDAETIGKTARYELILVERERQGNRERLTIRP